MLATADPVNVPAFVVDPWVVAAGIEVSTAILVSELIVELDEGTTEIAAAVVPTTAAALTVAPPSGAFP